MRTRTRSNCMVRISQRQYAELLNLSYTDLLTKLGTPTRNASRSWPNARLRPKTGTVVLVCSISKQYLLEISRAAQANGRRISEEFRVRLLEAAGVALDDSPARNRRGRSAKPTNQTLMDLYIHQSFMDEDRESRWPTTPRLTKWLEGQNASSDSTHSKLEASSTP